jgi:hypothetical protein
VPNEKGSGYRQPRGEDNAADDPDASRHGRPVRTDRPSDARVHKAAQSEGGKRGQDECCGGHPMPVNVLAVCPAKNEECRKKKKGGDATIGSHDGRHGSALARSAPKFEISHEARVTPDSGHVVHAKWNATLMLEGTRVRSGNMTGVAEVFAAEGPNMPERLVERTRSSTSWTVERQD